MLENMLENVRKKNPLIHNITNYVTVNDCANIVLACGASPIMADDKNEAAEITEICAGLNINIGTLNTRTIDAMLIAGKRSNELHHHVVLDPVGAGASKLRTDTARRLLKEVKFSVIRGNISEIKTLASGSGTTKGVDADVADKVTEENLEGSTRALSSAASDVYKRQFYDGFYYRNRLSAFGYDGRFCSGKSRMSVGSVCRSCLYYGLCRRGGV